MTRRNLLALAPALALYGQEPTFERIDTHNHVHRPASVLTDAMKKTGWRGLSICDSRESGSEPSTLGEMKQGTLAFSRSGGQRWAWATTFDARGFASSGFAGRVTNDLAKDFQNGAVAVKVWKNVGLAIRSSSGEYLMPDSPALLPVYEAIQKADRTLLTHLADPDVAWQPLDPNNPDASYYRSHPEWAMHGRPEVPSKPSILAARDRVLARYPKLRVIGCHLGSHEDDLPALAQRLDRFPNFAVDMASRLRYLPRVRHEDARQFLLRYQDRILYATDFTLDTTDETKAAEGLQRTHAADWQLLSSREPLRYANRETKGFALPEPVLRKIFRDNALRWLPGFTA